MVKRGALIGLISGIVLGLFLKSAEIVSGEKVYVLLLNIDFIYKEPLPELFEFVLHLAVAVIIGVLYVFTLTSFNITSQLNRWLTAFALTLPAVLLYFPLTILSVRETPAIDDFEALTWWTAGHILFAAAMAASAKNMHKKTPH
ncbi:hypothetical protein GJU41_05945 [Bacillus idriensis]|uniref:DUF1440 domain-containing protein n=1 Tax=Metabacillus idriensis TaxID=324768 RepID=A0A6I2M985_9BACI|nr:hypothetical protein [Metabacillus idriensis]MRX53506.1 hypothetical protein [Metabacillus idriensis]